MMLGDLPKTLSQLEFFHHLQEPFIYDFGKSKSGDG